MKDVCPRPLRITAIVKTSNLQSYRACGHSGKWPVTMVGQGRVVPLLESPLSFCKLHPPLPLQLPHPLPSFGVGIKLCTLSPKAGKLGGGGEAVERAGRLWATYLCSPLVSARREWAGSLHPQLAQSHPRTRHQAECPLSPCIYHWQIQGGCGHAACCFIPS